MWLDCEQLVEVGAGLLILGGPFFPRSDVPPSESVRVIIDPPSRRTGAVTRYYFSIY